MIIVAGGHSTRFGADKLLVEIGGKPLLSHTIDAVAPLVDQVVLVVRNDLVDRFASDDLIVVEGGEDRTRSEMNGLSASPPSTLIGIHDGARPAISAELIDSLFSAATDGGAVPWLEPDKSGIDNEVDHPTWGRIRVQTPQVFWGPELRAAYLAESNAGFNGPDTMSVVREFTNLEVSLVRGDPNNIKVTKPGDLEKLKLS
jgi:2-C-methyl-D-erythritol 4-phosphate cytidylyltransferase